jgi:N-acyl homoserine lactone hydrolase
MRLSFAIAVLALLLAPASAQNSEPPPLAQVTTPRLYALDCGTLAMSRPEDFGLTRDDVTDTNMIVSCFLVIHPKGILLFDTGLSDSLVGQPLYENRIGRNTAQVKLNTLKSQLAAIGVTPEKITYLALSHSHYDHVGNANAYAGSTWLAQKAERDYMFGPAAPARFKPQYAALEQARTRIIDGDHDVFADGTVLLKYMPGHTPGHQSLYVKLARAGGILLAGDLYHYPQERTLNRMPEREKTLETGASRAKMEEFLRQTGARLWIDHDIGAWRDALKAPAWYE